MQSPSIATPFVTPDTYEEARRYNFGRGLLTHPHTVDAVCARLDAWQRDAVQAVSERLRRECSLTDLVGTLERLYARVRNAHGQETHAAL